MASFSRDVFFSMLQPHATTAAAEVVPYNRFHLTFSCSLRRRTPHDAGLQHRRIRRSRARGGVSSRPGSTPRASGGNAFLRKGLGRARRGGGRERYAEGVLG